MRNFTVALLLVFTGCSAQVRGDSSSYDALLKNEKIAASIIWETESGPLAYPDWSTKQKGDLTRALAAVEAGKPAGLLAPPVPNTGHKIIHEKLNLPKKKNGPQCEDDGHVLYAANDAWVLYVAHIAHSLWLERHRKVGWSLSKMESDERALLLDSRLLQKRKDADEFEATRFVMGHALSWDPAMAYRFLVREKLLGKTPEDTVGNVTDWASMNLRHIRGGETYAAIYGYPGPIPIDRFTDPTFEGPKKVGGCWGVTGFYAGILRGVNIPVENSMKGKHEYNMHSRPVFPTAKRALNHGDDIYSTLVGASGNKIPGSRMLLTQKEWETLVQSPKLDCVAGKCNTKEEQADYNIGRRQRLLAREFLTDGFLAEYHYKDPKYVDESLQGFRVGGGFNTFAKPYLSAEERKAFISEIEAELKRLGGGDIKKGGKIANDRARAFYK